MAIIGSWNGFDFEVSPSVVRGFTGLTIKGGIETKDTVSGNQKFVQRKNSTATEITMTVYLNAYLGCKVRDEALRFITTAMEGKSNYFYVAGKKLVNCMLMLISAEVKETALAPDGTWISCGIGLTFKQSGKYDGIASGSSSSGSKPSGNKPSVPTGTTTTTTTTTATDTTSGASPTADEEAEQYIASQAQLAAAAQNAGKDTTVAGGGKPHFSVIAMK